LLGYFVGKTTPSLDTASGVEIASKAPETITEPEMPLPPPPVPAEAEEKAQGEEPRVLRPAFETAQKSPAEGAKKRAVKKSGQGVYSVQAGVFKNRAHAEKLMTKLKGKDYPAFIQASDKGVYTVKVGKFSSKKDASAILNMLKRTEGIEGLVVVSPG
jgi:cell division septation protein DedD